jgi:predicted amidohydrolase
MMRIGLVQMLCEKGAIEDNLASMARCLAEARQRAVDFVAFPEMSITGYADPTKYPHCILRLDGPEVMRFLEITQGSPAVVFAGLIEGNPDGKPYITQVAAQDGRMLGFYRKITIQDEEEHWFSAGKPVLVLERARLSYGLAVCADIHNQSVFAACARAGAQIVFELAAPGLYGAPATRDWKSGFEWWKGECQKLLGGYAVRHHLWIAVATQAGRTVDEDFPGGGYVFSPDGRCAFATPDGAPGAVYLELDLDQAQVTELSQG